MGETFHEESVGWAILFIVIAVVVINMADPEARLPGGRIDNEESWPTWSDVALLQGFAFGIMFAGICLLLWQLVDSYENLKGAA